MQTLLSWLSLAAYVGGVFVLPPVLGRRAARSRKTRIPFLIVLGIHLVLAICSFVGSEQISKKQRASLDPKSYDNIHDLENAAVGATCAGPMLGGTLLIGVILGLCAYAASGKPRAEGTTGPPPPTSP